MANPAEKHQAHQRTGAQDASREAGTAGFVMPGEEKA